MSTETQRRTVTVEMENSTNQEIADGQRLAWSGDGAISMTVRIGPRSMWFRKETSPAGIGLSTDMGLDNAPSWPIGGGGRRPPRENETQGTASEWLATGWRRRGVEPMSLTDRENDLDSITPESLRKRVPDLPLTASHAVLFPESLVWRKDIYSGIPDDEPAPVKEIWPGFECLACGSDRGEVAYEPAPGFEGEVPDRYDTIQFVWEGRRPACNRCGSGLSDQRIDQHRPPRWQQPIIGILYGVPRLSETHDPLMDAFDHDPVGFVRAEMDELRTIEGIGQRFARQIVVKKHGSFADRAPRPGADWPELHAEAKREARFA